MQQLDHENFDFALATVIAVIVIDITATFIAYYYL
jgi:hypothetical protein